MSARTLPQRLRMAAGGLRRAASGLALHWRPPCPPELGLPRRVWEQFRLLATNGITAQDYYVLRLDRADRPWTRKQEFIGEFDHWRWQHPLNPARYSYFTLNKLVFKRFVVGAGLATPELLGVFGPGGRAETGEPLATDAQLRAWIEASGAEEFVLKPVGGSRGTGVLVVGPRRPGALAWASVPSGTITLDELLAHRRRYRSQEHFLIERRVRPHPDLAPLAADVVHTARIVTALEEDVTIVDAALRIGLGTVPVDNFARGNLVAPIDLATGRLGAAASKRLELGRVGTHPVSGAVIAGRTVPDWEAALALVRAGARAAPFNRCLGWDVALTDRGPMILEANANWDPHVTQLAHDRGLLATPFRSYLARHHALEMIGAGWAKRPPLRPRPAAP